MSTCIGMRIGTTGSRLRERTVGSAPPARLAARPVTVDGVGAHQRLAPGWGRSLAKAGVGGDPSTEGVFFMSSTAGPLVEGRSLVASPD